MYKVAIIGKPNVGKSTIFNRICKEKKAIISDIEGTTRDRIYEKCQWLNKEFILIDTGGLSAKQLNYQQNIEQQVLFALEEANIILFVVSYQGINADDSYVVKILKKYRSNKKIYLVCNKAENNNFSLDINLINLGFGKPIYISAEHGIGMGNLLDEIISTMPKEETNNIEDHTSFCIIGKTNVGKSTLMNAILGKERSITSATEHTTRDAINEDFYYNKELFTIVDTAGIRRKGHITDEVEKYAILRTQLAIENCNMILFVIDISKPFTEQDEVIGGLAYKANIPTIIVVNKWDTIKDKNELLLKEKIKLIRQKFQFLSWAPIIFISAIEKKKINMIFETISDIKKQLALKVNTQMLNSVLAKAQLSNPAPKIKGTRISISYAVQIKSQIPSFVIFVNKPESLHFTYARYIENIIRESFGINKVPIMVYYKDKNSRVRESMSIKDLK